MHRARRVCLLALIIAITTVSVAEAWILDDFGGLYISFRGTTDFPVSLRVEVMATPTAGGAPVTVSSYAFDFLVGTPVTGHAALVTATLAADPLVVIGTPIVIIPGPDGVISYPIESADVPGMERIGIRAYSTSVLPLPPAIPGYTQGAWPPFPAGGVAFDVVSQGITGPPFGLVGTHIYADPPMLGGDGPPSSLDGLFITEGLPAPLPVPASSPWFLAAGIALLTAIGFVIALRIRRPAIR
jgi:hypothetical protein